MQMKKLHLIEEKFPHYEKSQKDFPLRNYFSFTNDRSEVVYGKMVERLMGAASAQQWLSVMRFSHGEFDLCLGKPPPRNIGLAGLARFYLGSFAKRFGIGNAVGYGGSLNDGKSRESLKFSEVSEAKKIWLQSMQQLSTNGLIAANFQDRPDSIDRIEPMRQFCEKHSIHLDADNYAPFFGVYAFICGPDFNQLVAGKHVVAVTWFDAEREAGVRKSCLDAGAASFEALPVSPHRAVLEPMDLSKLGQKPDVALFACGLGSAPRMLEFKDLNAVCLDAGFALDVLANPELRGKRAWTLPDYLYPNQSI
jgi:hypothetical protein